MQHIINNLIKIAQHEQTEKTAAPAFLANLLGGGKKARQIQNIKNLNRRMSNLSGKAGLVAGGLYGAAMPLVSPNDEDTAMRSIVGGLGGALIGGGGNYLATRLAGGLLPRTGVLATNPAARLAAAHGLSTIGAGALGGAVAGIAHDHVPFSPALLGGAAVGGVQSPLSAGIGYGLGKLFL